MQKNKQIDNLTDDDALCRKSIMQWLCESSKL